MDAHTCQRIVLISASSITNGAKMRDKTRRGAYRCHPYLGFFDALLHSTLYTSAPMNTIPNFTSERPDVASQFPCTTDKQSAIVIHPTQKRCGFLTSRIRIVIKSPLPFNISHSIVMFSLGPLVITMASTN